MFILNTRDYWIAVASEPQKCNLSTQNIENVTVKNVKNIEDINIVNVNV